MIQIVLPPPGHPDLKDTVNMSMELPYFTCWEPWKVWYTQFDDVSN